MATSDSPSAACCGSVSQKRFQWMHFEMRLKGRNGVCFKLGVYLSSGDGVCFKCGASLAVEMAFALSLGFTLAVAMAFALSVGLP